jgi:hypothetical protein
MMSKPHNIDARAAIEDIAELVGRLDVENIDPETVERLYHSIAEVREFVVPVDVQREYAPVWGSWRGGT